MAHKKGQGSTRNGRDSAGQRRGIKKFGGEKVIPGNIIIRQLGTKVYPGAGVDMGRDYTIFAVETGTVKFEDFVLRSGKARKRVSVVKAA